MPKKKPDGRKLAKEILDEWLERLGLLHIWDIGLVFSDKPKTGTNGMDIEIMNPYNKAIITINVNYLKVYDRNDMEFLIVHECMHLLLREFTNFILTEFGRGRMKKELENVEEGAADSLAKTMIRLHYGPDSSQAKTQLMVSPERGKRS